MPTGYAKKWYDDMVKTFYGKERFNEQEKRMVCHILNPTTEKQYKINEVCRTPDTELAFLRSSCVYRADKLFIIQTTTFGDVLEEYAKYCTEDDLAKELINRLDVNTLSNLIIDKKAGHGIINSLAEHAFTSIKNEKPLSEIEYEAIKNAGILFIIKAKKLPFEEYADEKLNTCLFNNENNKDVRFKERLFDIGCVITELDYKKLTKDCSDKIYDMCMETLEKFNDEKEESEYARESSFHILIDVIKAGMLSYGKQEELYNVLHRFANTEPYAERLLSAMFETMTNENVLKQVMEKDKETLKILALERCPFPAYPHCKWFIQKAIRNITDDLDMQDYSVYYYAIKNTIKNSTMEKEDYDFIIKKYKEKPTIEPKIVKDIAMSVNTPAQIIEELTEYPDPSIMFYAQFLKEFFSNKKTMMDSNKVGDLLLCFCDLEKHNHSFSQLQFQKLMSGIKENLNDEEQNRLYSITSSAFEKALSHIKESDILNKKEFSNTILSIENAVHEMKDMLMIELKREDIMKKPMEESNKKDLQRKLKILYEIIPSDDVIAFYETADKYGEIYNGILKQGEKLMEEENRQLEKRGRDDLDER